MRKGKCMSNQLKAKIILLLSLFLVMLGFGIIIPILPFYVEQLGGGSVVFGIVMTAYSLMQFFFAPMWGRLSDRIGRRPVLLIGLGGYAVTFTLLGLSSNYWMLIGFRALAGMVSSATIPTAMAYLSDITDPGERSKNMGMVGASMGLGMTFGPAIGGWVGQYGMSVPFYLAGGIALLIMPFAMAFLPESLITKEKKEIKTKVEISNPLLSGQLFKDPLLVVFLVNFVMNFTLALFESTFALLVAYKVGYGPDQIGNIFAVLGVTAIIVQGGLIGLLVKRFGDVSVAKAGIILCSFGMILIMSSPNIVLITITTALFMAGNSLMGPTSSSIVSKRSGDAQGASLGLLQSFGSLGRMLGPLIGGVLYAYSQNLPYLVGGLVLVFTFIIGNKGLNKFRENPGVIL